MSCGRGSERSCFIKYTVAEPLNRNNVDPYVHSVREKCSFNDA